VTWSIMACSCSPIVGFRIPSPEWRVDRVSIADITPEQFYEKYILTRTPCILTGVLDLKEFKCKNWTIEYLREVAGDTTVRVERRKDTKSMYGRSAPREPMLFKDFLAQIESGAQDLYLTSQTEDYEGSELPAIYAAPLTNLRTDFTLHPPFACNLIPYQVNLWMGNSKEGSSSGLHHDYHDNFYVLLRGYKRFNIFPPCDAPRLAMLGTVNKVHRNGLIVYEHCAGLPADGVPEDRLLDVVPLWYICLRRARQRIHDALLSKGGKLDEEKASGRLTDSAEDDEEYDERKVWEHFEIQGMTPDELTDRIYGTAEMYNSFSEEELRTIRAEFDAENEVLQKKIFAAKAREQEELLCADDVENVDDSVFEGEVGADSDEEPHENKREKSSSKTEATMESKPTDAKAVEAEIYSHFSTLPKDLLYALEPNEKDFITSMSDETKAFWQDRLQRLLKTNPLWEKKYGQDLNMVTKGTVYIQPNECLYLPSGWMHEVTSYNENPLASNAQAETDETRTSEGCHVALNYWYHPPDRVIRAKDKGLDAGTLQRLRFRQPYAKPFWHIHWEKHHGAIEREMESRFRKALAPK